MVKATETRSHSSLVFGFFLLIVLALSGCGNNPSFTQDTRQVGSLGTGEIPGQADPATQVVAAQCEAAAAANQLQSVNQTLVFQDPGRSCDWGRNGNLGKRDQWHQGRIEQDQSVALPTGSTLCHVAFDFPQQKFRFDDHFWFAINDVIMASSLNYDDRFGVTNGFSLFDWSKLVGTHWDKQREGVWCLGGAQCDWPDTEEDGPINMNFRVGTYYAVTARDRTRTSHVFKFVTVGDNDASDCQHRPVSMNVTLRYIR